MTTSVTTRVQVFDPAMCCSTGVCGPSVDTSLARFASDLEYLKAQGLMVDRYNLSQQPGAFADNETVRSALHADPDCLPLILADGKVIAKGGYPESRNDLLGLLGLEAVEESCCGEDEEEEDTGSCEPSSGCC